MPPEALSTVSSDEVEIYYDLYRVAENRIVLVVPGFWRHRRYPTLIALADRITAAGASVAIMDIRGHGDSGGRFGFNRDEFRDVLAVANGLVATGFQHIDVIGFSLGGSIAITAISRGPEIPWGSAMIISAVADFGRLRPWISPWKAHHHLALSQATRMPRFDWGFGWHGKVKAEDEIARARVPLTIVHARGDWLVGHRHGETLFARASDPKSLHILEIPGRWHADRLLTAAGTEMDFLLDEFLKK